MKRLKLLLASLGFTLAVAGVALDQRPLVWGAMAGLAGALGIRLWERRQRDARSSDPSSASGNHAEPRPPA